MESCVDSHPKQKTGEEHLSKCDCCVAEYTFHSPRRYGFLDLLVFEMIEKHLERREALKDSNCCLKGRNDKAKKGCQTNRVGSLAVGDVLDYRVGRRKEKSCQEK